MIVQGYSLASDGYLGYCDKSFDDGYTFWGGAYASKYNPLTYAGPSYDYDEFHALGYFKLDKLYVHLLNYTRVDRALRLIPQGVIISAKQSSAEPMTINMELWQ